MAPKPQITSRENEFTKNYGKYRLPHGRNLVPQDQTGYTAIDNALNNRRTRINKARNSVFDCHFSPNDNRKLIDLRSSIV